VRVINLIIRRKHDMNKEKREKQAQQRAKDKFNSESNSVKVHNQNQGHNVKEEGIGRQNNKY